MGTTKHSDVHIISENKRTKMAEKRLPESPFFNNYCFQGQPKAKAGHCMVVIHRTVNGKVTSTTKHCVPPGSAKFLADNSAPEADDGND